MELLRENVGFDEPARWVDYALAHDFERVEATRLTMCPDCGSTERSPVGQYVYYSSLMRLFECTCGLLYSDVRLAPSVVARHFEVTYKDEAYFRERRRLIFRSQAELLAKEAPKGGVVLDWGGAEGHFLEHLGKRRPDLELVLNDLSQVACAGAAERLGLRVIPGGIEALAPHAGDFDVVVLSDVVYYEPDIAALWELLPRLLRDNGLVLIRVPNKLWLMRLAMSLARSRSEALVDRIPFFNPEHIYVLSRSYLARRLRECGFERVAFLPSPPLAAPGRAALARLWFSAARAARTLSRGRWLLTPSMTILARRSAG